MSQAVSLAVATGHRLTCPNEVTLWLHVVRTSRNARGVRGGGNVRDEGVELLGDPFWPFSQEHVRAGIGTQAALVGRSPATRRPYASDSGVVGSPEHERRGRGYPNRSQAASTPVRSTLRVTARRPAAPSRVSSGAR